MPYCPKCGKEVKEDAVFCPYCGATLKPEVAQSAQGVVYRRHRNIDEKNEKNEKREKDERQEKAEKQEKGEKHEGEGFAGAVMGGLVIIWLGATFILREYNFITYGDWFAWFMAGLGVILVVRGLMTYMQTNKWRAGSGFIIGGVVVAMIGIASIAGLREWWPLAVIVIGAWIIVGAYTARERNPRP